MYHRLVAVVGLITTSLVAAQGAPGVVSQFLGTSSVDVTFSGDPVSASISSEYLSACTTYLQHQLGTANLVPSLASQLFSAQVSAVCELCTSLSQTRVDSCCGQSTASACFARFGDNGAGAAEITTTMTGPAKNSATATLTGATSGATGTGSGMTASSTGATTSGNSAGSLVANKDILAQSILITLLGIVGLAL